MALSSRSFRFLRPPVPVAVQAISFGLPLGLVLARLSFGIGALTLFGAGWLCSLIAADRSRTEFHPVAWWWVYVASVALGVVLLMIAGSWLLYVAMACLLINFCRVFVGLSSNPRTRKE